ncbi:hypothetical protein EDD18DRAFT_367116 [Armillaria luteobubalina]|uniref:Uncharacterized protein n=1 Tax=Armillaria luteobubalina TaxID=153913 RepID=A0AA39Q291_9AGAR|nr:hypothetical protein EDD18DRAFT_367116 [Armillaria luteobubalina]
MSTSLIPYLQPPTPLLMSIHPACFTLRWFCKSSSRNILSPFRIILLRSLIPHCFVLCRRAISGCAACRQDSRETLPIIIDFYFYSCILHPIRRLRVLCWSYISPRFRDGAIVKVPRDCIFPQELCEVIIRFCSSDRKALFTCNLVCNGSQPVDTLLCTCVHFGDHVREFVELLRFPDSIKSPHIQTIWLETYTKRGRLIQYRYACCALADVNAMPTRALITGQSLDPVTELFHYFPQIKRLSFDYKDLGDHHVESAANFRRILWYSSLFCDLERLLIRFVHLGAHKIYHFPHWRNSSRLLDYTHCR